MHALTIILRNVIVLLTLQLVHAHRHTCMQVRLFVDSAYKKTLALVETHRDRITAMANELLKKEVRAYTLLS